MMMGPEIDVGALSQLSSENLRVLLRKIPGSKDMMIEPSLIAPLDKIAGMSMIKSCGVNRVFKLESKRPEASTASTRVYFLRPSLEQTKFVVDHVNGTTLGNVSFHLIFMPRTLRQVEILLEEEGLHGKVAVHDYSWELIPFDYDLLSLEMPWLFGQLYQDEDASLLSSVANSLAGIQTLFGHVANRVAVGRHSVAAFKQLALIEQGSPSTLTPRRDISHLFLIDRDVDYATLLLSPLTYESLLSEVFVSTCGSIELDSRVTKSDNSVKLQLSSRDKMFAKIRTQHFSNIFSSLSSYAKQLKQQQAKAASMSIGEMKSFIQKDLKEVQDQSKAVALHIGACEVIQKEQGPIYEVLLPIEHALLTGTGYNEALAHIEDSMAQLQPFHLTLRLLCLTSHCNNGLPSSDYQRLKQQFVQTYGFDQLLTLNLLKRIKLLTIKVGLLRTPSNHNNRPPFQQIAKKLSLNKVNPAAPVASSQMQDDTAYVFNGAYLPLTCKLVRDGLKSKQALQEDLNELQLPHKVSLSDQQDAAAKVVVVYFVGGYTLSEVAAFRHLQTILGYQFIICGTSGISGKSMLGGLK